MWAARTLAHESAFVCTRAPTQARKQTHTPPHYGRSLDGRGVRGRGLRRVTCEGGEHADVDQNAARHRLQGVKDPLLGVGVDVALHDADAHADGDRE